MLRILALLCLLASVRVCAAEAQPVPRTVRLARLCKVWGAVKFLHPWVWTRDVDWDGALLRALPRARAAASDDELAAAVATMLAELHDPVTRVLTTDEPMRYPAPRDGGTFASWPKPGVLRLELAAPHTPAELDKAIASFKQARQLVVDARIADGKPRMVAAWNELERIVQSLITRELRVPPVRWVMHDGYRPQDGAPTSYQSTIEEDRAELVPLRPNAIHRPLAIVSNAAVTVPHEALALQAAGDAAIVLVGTTLDGIETAGRDLRLDPTHAVRLRTLERVPLAGAQRTVELPADADEARVLASALAALRALAHPSPPAAALPPLVWRPDKSWASDKAPSTDLRLLALFRFWNVFDRFYPYKALLDENWDDVLTAFIPRFEAAEGAHAYVQAVAELTTHIEDTHVAVGGGDDPEVSARSRPRLLPALVEHQPVVLAVAGDEETRKSDIHVGDVILSVDGEAIGARMARLRRFVTASYDGGRDRYALLKALSGAEGSTATLTVRGGDGKLRTVMMTRHLPRMHDIELRSGEAVRMLDGNVGYVDLDRLTHDQVDAMFEKLAKTRALIFDMRGYPNGTAWDIAPRINVRAAAIGAVVERCLVRGWPYDEGPRRTKMTQPISANASGKPLYRGKTFLLVDERTGSQGEHTGLMFEAAAGTRIVGSHTAGADGDVTMLGLPGGLTVSFSGSEVRHVDGRPVQRVGLPIDVQVRPTIHGLQAGRDEVLERALGLAR